MSWGRVVVTGGAGYIGSVLVGLLLERGYEVVVVDRLFFGDTLAHLRQNPSLTIVQDDIRSFGGGLLEGADTVCDLAALSNDPAGELDPERTLEINFRARERVARLAKEYGVRRYVLASSCSIYGFQEGVLDEESPTNPLTVYARANLAAEKATLHLASDTFTVTVLRQATVYGLSARMRFDLAINGMTLGLYRDCSIPVLRDGTQWRPMVHVRDTSAAFLRVLEADQPSVSGQVFNVGSDEQNFQILPLAEMVSRAAGVPFDYSWYGDPDHRSYRVSFAKIRDVLGYRTEYSPADAAREIVSALAEGRVKPGPETRTVEWYKLLLSADPAILDPPSRERVA